MHSNWMSKMGTRFLSLLLATIMVLTLFPAAALAAPDADLEHALEADPLTADQEALPLEQEVEPSDQAIRPLSADITIENTAQLVAFLNGTLGQNHYNFELAVGGTFNLSGEGPFQGRGMVGGHAFTGTFNGNGQTITGLRLVPSPASVPANATLDGSIGFIRLAGPGARVENVTFQGLTGPANRTFLDAAPAPAGWAAVEGAVGTVIGRVAGGPQAVVIQDVHMTGSTYLVTARANTATNKHIGGFVGRVDSGSTLHIHNISSASLILFNQTGRTQSVGGVVGTSNGTVRLNTPAPVGIAPAGATANLNVRVIGLNATSGDNMPNFAGGVIGRMEAGAASIYNVNLLGGHLDSEIHGRSAAGGVVGWAGTAGQLHITNATNNLNQVSTLIADGRAGGIVGRAGNTIFLRTVRNHAGVTHLAANANNIGGIVGRTDGPASMIDAQNHGYVRHGFSGGVGHVGGILGHAGHHTTITNATNYGNVRLRGASGTTAAVHNQSVGGIIGNIQFPTAVPAAQRRANLTEVSNRGNINNVTITNSNVAGREQLTISAGGIVGRTRNVASAAVFINGATNYGEVRARNRVGGIVGFSDMPNLHIRYAMNHGRIAATESSSRSQAGGIVGADARANLLVERSGNTGMIRVMRGTSGGAGGLIGQGHSGSGQTTIRESFNTGHVSHPGPGAGGLMGRNSGGNVLIEDAYNIGPVQGGAATAAGNRSGTGVLGIRGGGTITIRRVYVSGMWGLGRTAARDLGPAVAISGTGTARPVASINFSQVYVIRDTAPTADGARMQTGRAGIQAMPTELLTSGFLPGFQGRSPIDGEFTW
ncbi:MAG: hypothetical protein FWD84_01905, partial [Oscillospiraceae bacterium]|nr:hypothetical protein [Oscillospiraceae bacterium]